MDEYEGLGRLQELKERWVRLQGYKAIKPAVLVMCGDHGVAERGVSAFSQEVTEQMIRCYIEGGAAINVLADLAGANIFVTDLGTKFDLRDVQGVRQAKVAKGTKDFTVGPAMTLKELQAGIAAGLQVAAEIIDKGYNLLITAEMGIGNTTSSAALNSAMLGLPASITVGRGSGINDERLAKKRALVEQGLQVNAPQQGDGLDCLRKVGGFEHAGLVGMMMSAAAHNIPVLLDGVNATAAALCAVAIEPKVKDCLFASHLSAETAHSEALTYLGLQPVLKVGMRVGEGTGACLAVPVLRAALAVEYQNNRQ